MTAATYHSLAGRTVVVTGGATGIGEGVVRGFAANGARVVFLDIQEQAGSALAAELTQGGAEVFFRACDLIDTAAIADTFREIRARFGPVGSLVNNAAVDNRAAFLDLAPGDFDWMMSANLRHVFFASQAVAPDMIAQGHGSIVNMTSVAWMRGIANLQAYSIAKAGIVGLTNSLARELGPHGIRVNAVSPGMVITERQRRLWFDDEARIEAATAQQCLPGPISVADIAAAVLFLAADDSRMITKQVLVVNAGSY